MDESEFKTKIAKKLNEEGGYGRRIEDQYAVGIPDMNLIPVGGPVFFVEAKIIRSAKWGATPRQMEELKRIRNASAGNALACEMGFDKSTMTICLRRIEDPREKWCYTQITQWTKFSVTDFLKFCIEEWRILDGR